MSKRNTLISNTEKDHVYTVVIGTDMGQFEGSVFCRPEDRDHESSYFGWEQAEIRATEKYAKAKIKNYAARLKALTDFLGMMSNTRTFSADAYWVKKMEQEIEDLRQIQRDWKRYARHLEEQYHLNIVNFDNFNSTRNRCQEYNQDKTE
jgi:hypothetical protein